MTARETFRDFIWEMSRLKLPVRFLFELADSHYFIAEAWNPPSRVYPAINLMLLEESVLYDLTLVRTFPLNVAGGASVAYHEATHAWLDMNSDLPEVVALRRDGIAHYEHARLESGAKPDATRLFEEAIGTYVQTRVGAYLSAWASLMGYRRALEKRYKADRRDPEHVPELIDEVSWSYDREMRERVFGYQDAPAHAGKSSTDDQDLTTQPITPAMKLFADRRLLEDRIPDLFVQARELTRMRDQLLEDFRELLTW